MGGKSGGKIKIAEYSLSLHIGLCLSGPDLALVAVRYGGKEFWRSAGATARSVFGIVSTDLFGGEEKEGGLKGMMWWLPGAATQRLPAAIYNRLGYGQDTHPGFRGVATLFFHGTSDQVTPPESAPGEQVGYAELRSDTHNRKSKVAGRAGFYWCANNPYLKKLGVRLRRPSTGLDPDLAMIRIEDDSNGNAQYAANPAHMLYECVVSQDFGSGEDPANVNIDSYNAAAQTFFDEGLGLSVLWDRRSSVDEFSAEIQRHVNAVQYIDPATGRFTLRALRRDYDPEELTEINPSNATISQLRRRTWAECPNEIVVPFTLSETGKSGSVTVQDLAAIAAQGARISVTRSYPMAPSRAIATKLAERDLAQEVAPLMGCQVTVTRAFWEAFPSHVYRLSWPRYGIDGVICRVLEVNRDEDTVTMNLAEDIFGVDASSYVAVAGTQWQSPNRPPSEATLYRLGTAPAFMVAEALGLTSPADIEVGDAMAAVYVGADGPGQIGYEMMTASVDVSGTSEIESLGQKPMTSSWVTLASLPAEAQSTMTTFSGLRGAAPAAGDFVLIGDGGDAATEIALVRAVNVLGTVINRGVLDTVPRAWPAGTRMWCIPHDLAVSDETVRAEGETARYWFLPQTPGGVLDLDSAREVSVTLSNRARRPNRPANVRVNGQGFGVVDATASSLLSITWATRNRGLESSQVLGWTDASVAGESGQTTTVRALGPTGAVIATFAGLAGTSLSLPVSGIAGARFIEVAAVRSGLESLQAYRIEVLL